MILNMIMSHMLISEAIKFTARDHQSVIADPNLQIGYEIEFVAVPNKNPIPSTAAPRKFKNINDQHAQVVGDLLDQLNALNLGSSVTYMSGSKNWQLVEDNSIRPDPQRPGLGFELVSPPQPVQTALINLKKVFAWLHSQGHYTNDSTGFHVGVSWGTPGNMRKIDRLKVALLLGEHYLIGLFDRAFNEFTQSHLDKLREQLSALIKKKTAWTRSRDLDLLIHKIGAQVDLKKYRTINFGKLSQGYLEFRIMGNRDYDRRLDEIVTTILRYAFVVKAALDPQAFEQPYYQALGRLMADAISAARPQFADLPTKYAVLGSLSRSATPAQLDKAQKTYQDIQTALGNRRYTWSVPALAKMIADADTHADDPDQVAGVINAAALSYRLLLRKHGISMSEFKRVMLFHRVDPSTVNTVMHYLKTY